MRFLAIAFATTASILVGMPGASAAARPWCMLEGGSAPLCLYHNFQQCYESTKGVGGLCIENPVLAFRRGGAGYNDDRSRRRARVPRGAQ